MSLKCGGIRKDLNETLTYFNHYDDVNFQQLFTVAETSARNQEWNWKLLVTVTDTDNREVSTQKKMKRVNREPSIDHRNSLSSMLKH